MLQSSNGQSLPQPERAKPRRHNAKRCRFAKRQAIVYALANNQSIASITRDLRVSRHTVLAVRNTSMQDIEAVRERIAAVIELRCYELSNEAMEKIGRQIEVECSPVKLVKIWERLIDKAMMLHTPVQTRTPEPFELKFGKFRRAKQNERSSFPAA